jgi:hypothetical protein
MTTIGQTTVTLPSKGLLYDGLIPDGKVKIRCMTSQELSKLSQGGSPLDKIEGILKNTVELPKDIKISDLIITDRFYLLLAVRTASFGGGYQFRYKCHYCASVNKEEVDIAEDLQHKNGGVSEDGDVTLYEPFDVPLKDADCIVQCKFLRGVDEHRVFKHAKRLKMQGIDRADSSEVYRISLQIISKNDTEFTSQFEKQDFIKSMTAADTIRLEQAIDTAEPGVDLTVFPECGSCGALNELEMPFDAEFFRPTQL